MKKFACHKVVEAFKILRIDFLADGRRELIGESDRVAVGCIWFEKHDPDVGGYFVRYADGYESFSPAAAFESGYTELVEV